jgi:enoyl-CoA hydratase
MTYQTILTSQDGPARILTLDRPDRRNAVSTLMMQEIIDELKTAEAEETVRAVIITGGPSFFSAGADLNEAMQEIIDELKTAEAEEGISAFLEKRTAQFKGK